MAITVDKNTLFQVEPNKTVFSSFTTISHRRRDTYTISDDKETERTVINPDGSITIDKSANSSTIRGYQIWDASQKFGYAFTDQFSAEIKGTYYRNNAYATANAKPMIYFQTTR